MALGSAEAAAEAAGEAAAQLAASAACLPIVCPSLLRPPQRSQTLDPGEDEGWASWEDRG